MRRTTIILVIIICLTAALAIWKKTGPELPDGDIPSPTFLAATRWTSEGGASSPTLPEVGWVIKSITFSDGGDVITLSATGKRDLVFRVANGTLYREGNDSGLRLRQDGTATNVLFLFSTESRKRVYFDTS
jgi:hypothetical protein